MKFAGIDYHKRYSVVCIVDEAGRELALEQIEHSFPSGFERLLSAHTPCAVAFEATMNWSWLHELIELLADTLPARAEHLASRRASVDAAAGRGE